MVPRWVKATYYAGLSPIMRLNARRHLMMGTALATSRRVHLGPGQKNYLDGWVNVDANVFSSRPDVWADLRFELPFPDASVEAIYSHHVIEHLPDLDAHFTELFRCLAPGGVLRVGGPHGDNAIRAMQQGDAGWFGDFPVPRKSLGGRFENFIFCKGEHLTILTESFLRELAEDAGFREVQVVVPGQTRHARLFDGAVMALENEDRPDLPHTLLIEAVKPA